MIIFILANSLWDDASIPRCALYYRERNARGHVGRERERISAFNEIHGNPQIKL